MKEEEIERRFKVSVTAKTPPGIFQQAIASSRPTVQNTAICLKLVLGVMVGSGNYYTQEEGGVFGSCSSAQKESFSLSAGGVGEK